MIVFSKFWKLIMILWKKRKILACFICWYLQILNGVFKLIKLKRETKNLLVKNRNFPIFFSEQNITSILYVWSQRENDFFLKYLNFLIQSLNL